jgi:hypothetical protein
MNSFIQTRCKKKQTSDAISNVFLPGTITCVYGKPGTGKTQFVNKELPTHISLDHTILKSKQSTIDFFERLRHTETPVVIDNWESLTDLIGIREITEPISKGPLVIISHKPVQLTRDTILYEIPVWTTEQLTELFGQNASPYIYQLARECDGDIRFFLQSLEHTSDARDVFKTPVELVEDLLTTQDPMKYLSETLHEYGYIASAIQENYIHAKGITIDACASISESQSLADVYDDVMYRTGTWDNLISYFLTAGCVYPAILIDRKLTAKNIRPGSSWTKFQNICMRHKKVKETRLSVDALRVIRAYVEQGQLTLLSDYKLTDTMIDVFNHICIGNKLKPKLIDQAKKYVRANF